MLKIEKKMYVTVDQKGFMSYLGEAEFVPNAENRMELGKIFSNPDNIAWEICFPHENPKQPGMYCLSIAFCVRGMNCQAYALDCQPIISYGIHSNGVGFEITQETAKIPA